MIWGGGGGKIENGLFLAGMPFENFFFPMPLEIYFFLKKAFWFFFQGGLLKSIFSKSIKKLPFFFLTTNFLDLFFPEESLLRFIFSCRMPFEINLFLGKAFWDLFFQGEGPISSGPPPRSLRPPHWVKMAYQLPPIQCCFIAIYICIEPSQTYGPAPGLSPLPVTA